MKSLNIPGCEKRPLKVETRVRIPLELLDPHGKNGLSADMLSPRFRTSSNSARGAGPRRRGVLGSRPFSPLPPVETLRHPDS
jgi:hypothetical protein